MAAPASITVKDLSGKWLMNKTLSDSTDEPLAIQGVGYITRKGIGLATITLHVKQYQGPPGPPSASAEEVTHIDIEQHATGGIKGTTEKRTLDNSWREHSDWLFGKVKGQTRWVKKPELTEVSTQVIGADGVDHLSSDWTDENDEFVLSHVESLDKGWTATQIWGFQNIGGERRFARNIVLKKGSEKVEVRFYYDYLGPL